MIKSFLSDSERNGTGCLRSHATLDRGEFLEKILLQNQITTVASTPKYIEVNTYSHMTLWELIKIAAAKLNQSPRRIELRRSDNKKPALDANSHSKLLRDLKFENYEIIQVQKKPQVNQRRKELLDKNKQFTKEARAVFTDWFHMFSEDGFMTPLTCTEFIKFTTGSPNLSVLPGDERINVLFNKYDLDKDGKLSIDDFFKFYNDACVAKPEVVWSNL